MAQALSVRARSACAHPHNGFPILSPVLHGGRSLVDVRQQRHEPLDFPRNRFFVDACGEIVRGEAILLAGQPGSNKSTLARQLAGDLGLRGQRTLFLLTEETEQRHKAGFLRLESKLPPVAVRRILSNIHAETGIQDVQFLPDFFVNEVLNQSGAYHGVSMIVLDSIQGPGLSANDFDRWQAFFRFAALTRAAQILLLAVCHVTKRGETAGPKALEHAVDCSILLRKAYTRRLMSVLKNRFGPETARPIQLELEAPTVRLRPSPHAEMLPAVARGYLPGAGLTEVQGAVTLPKPGVAAKVTAPGLPRKEIEQYVSGLCQVPGFELADFDLSIQCRVPGERHYRSVLGLPLCMALAASFIQQPIPPEQIQLGEIDLCRNVRDVPAALLNDLSNSIASGEITLPVRILCPPSAVSQLPTGAGIEIVPCRRLDDAVFSTWPQLR